MKKKKHLLYKLFPSYLLITLVSLLAVSWYALSFTRQFYLERTQADLEVSGRLLQEQVVRLLSPLDETAVDLLCKDAAGQTDTRVTVVLPDGRVVGDSEEAPANMDNHRDREEIRQAYQGKIGMSIRHSDTISQNMMYVALPLYTNQQLAGVLRMSLAVTAIDDRIGTIRWRIAAGALLVALLASGVSWLISRRITQPLEKMRDGARRFADGDLFHRLPLSDIREFSGLAETMNQMAEQLQQRIDEINSQRSKTQAVLASMREGVIATDLEQRVININPTAAKMFAIPIDGRLRTQHFGNRSQPRVPGTDGPQSLHRGESRVGYRLSPEGRADLQRSLHAPAGCRAKAHGRAGCDQRCDPAAAAGEHAP